MENAEEIDEELSEVENEIVSGLASLAKLKQSQKPAKRVYLKNRLQRAVDLYRGLKAELRYYTSADAETYFETLKNHRKLLDKLSKQIKTEDPNLESMTVDEMLDKAAKLQQGDLTIISSTAIPKMNNQ